MKNKSLAFYILLTFVSLVHGGSAIAANGYEHTAKSIQIMQEQITSIKNKINNDQQIHHKIKTQITIKNKEIAEAQQAHKNLITNIQLLEQQIKTLQMTLSNTKKTIKAYKKSIYEHLGLHLKISEEPLWQVVFGAKNPFEYYQRIDLYQYIYQSEQKKLHALQASQKTLDQTKANMQEKIKNLASLETLLIKKEEQFTKEVQIHHLKLTEIASNIDQKIHQLHHIEKNQAHLKHLIQGLLKENRLQSARPFSVMKQRLDYPIHTSPTLSRKIQNGLLFKVKENAPVFAVSQGRVVFSDWLNGYGYLVIIDHGWGFMTLYGNNQTLIAKKGQNVKQGEKIALVGRSGAFQQTGLYFEIRKQAKVIAANTWFQNHA